MEVYKPHLYIQPKNLLTQILNKPISLQTKIFLIQGLKEKLRDLYQLHGSNYCEKPICDLSTTFFTSSKSIMMNEEEDGLIEHILKKQTIKIENDQEIETCEDDLNEITKTIQSKQLYNDELGIKIALRNREIEEEKMKEKKLKKVKSSPSLFEKIFG